MKPRRPALRLSYLRARLFQCLALEVIPLQQPPLLLRELFNRRTHPRAHLLELQPLIRRQGLIGEAPCVRPLEAGGEHHRQPRHRVGDVHDIIVNGPPAVASPLLAVRQISQVRRGPLAHEGVACIPTPQYPHLAQTIVDGALDAVVREGQEVGSHLRVKPLRRLQETNLPIGDELLELELGRELLAHGRRERPDVRSVLLQKRLLIFAQSQERRSLGLRPQPLESLVQPGVVLKRVRDLGRQGR